MAGNFNYPQVNYGALTSGLNALGQGFSNYATGMRDKQLGTDVATALTSNNPDLNALAQKYAQAGKPDVALKILEYKQNLDAKNAPEWAVNTVTGDLFNKNSPTPPGPSMDLAEDPATAGMNPAQKKAFLVAKGRAAGTSAGLGQPTPQVRKGNVSSALHDLAYYYQQLDQEGASVDPNQPDTWRNVRAHMGASPLGQMVEGMIGTKAQTTRDQINTVRPALINAIRQATGMSAKAMDSNVELQFYLKQATDPAVGRDANYAALRQLDKQYGLGDIDKAIPPDVLSRMPDQQQQTHPTFGPEFEGKTVIGPDKNAYIIKNGQPIPVGQ